MATSLSSPAETRRFPPGLPATLRWGNYADAWTQSPFGRWLVNSATVSVTCMLSNIVLSNIVLWFFVSSIASTGIK